MLSHNRKSILLFALISTLIMAWGSLPDWAGYAAQDSHSSFTGTYFDAQDYAVHVAMIRAGMQGAWGYNLRFTSEPQQTAYIRLFYVVLGEADRLLNIDPELLYQIVRWIFGYTALLAIYILAGRCFAGSDARWVWLAFLLAVLGSGLGWLQRTLGWVPGQITPIDFWLIDGYVLFSLSLFPHFAFTLSLMCLALVCYLDYLQAGGRLRVGAVAVAALIVQFVNPIAFIVVDAAMAAAMLMHWAKRDMNAARGWIALGVIAVAQIPLLVYNLTILGSDPIWSQFTRQNGTLSPPPLYYLWGYGLLWPLVVLGGIQALRRQSTIFVSALTWIVIAFALAYAPFPIQRRFLLGVTIPLGMLAAHGLVEVFRFVSQRNTWLSRRVPALTMLIVLCIAMTNLTLFPAQAFYMLSRPPDYFYPASLQPAFNWITSHTGPNDLVLSSPRMGQLLAQKTGRRVFLGHEMETLNYGTKKLEVDSYYKGQLRVDPLAQYGEGWVFYGPYERSVSSDFVPGPELRLEFETDTVAIYKVLAPPSP